MKRNLWAMLALCAPPLLAACSTQSLAAFQAGETKAVAKAEAVCKVATTGAIVLVPIAEGTLNAAGSANGAATVDAVNAVGQQACAAVNAIYVATQTAPAQAVTPAPAPGA